MSYWAAGSGGIGRRLADARAAQERADASDGVHFSFEKCDHVTRTAVRGRFTSGVSEEAHHRSALVSFALTEAVVAEAETATSGGACASIESDEDEAAEAEAAACASEAHRAATAAAAAAAFERRHESLALKRSAGKRQRQRRSELGGCSHYVLYSRVGTVVVMRL